MAKTGISAGLILTPKKEIRNALVEFENGVITTVQKIDKSGVQYPDSILIPGLIDIHIHGCMGSGVMKGEFKEISEVLAQHGVTSFLPTGLTAEISELVRVARALQSFIRSGKYSSEPLGFNMEGPWISGEKPGAMSKKFAKSPNLEDFERISSIAPLKIATIAPEVCKKLQIIREISLSGTVVSLGHSNATYELTKKAIASGARLGTHLFNAMRQLHHRDPGIVCALLEDPEVYCEVIPDLLHIHPAVLSLVIKVKGFDRIVLVSDATEVSGLSDGEYEFSLGWVEVKSGVCRNAEGSLGGSTILLDKGLKNINMLGFPLKEAVKMVTLNPAKLLGLESRKGNIGRGADADLVLLNRSLGIEKVIVRGREVVVG
jgi:N-acetylglucosamine-6-phosphate deacetylase